LQAKFRRTRRWPGNRSWWLEGRRFLKSKETQHVFSEEWKRRTGACSEPRVLAVSSAQPSQFLPFVCPSSHWAEVMRSGWMILRWDLELLRLLICTACGVQMIRWPIFLFSPRLF
jgi:hypothetical protein